MASREGGGPSIAGRVLGELANFIPVVGPFISSAFNVREARRNREWQERMSSTAHQREVADLRAAGINPMLSRMGSGASSPGGDRAEVEDPARGLSSALQLRMMKAQIGLTEAQARAADASALHSRAQVGDLNSMAAAGRYREIANRADAGELDVRQRQELFDVVQKQAVAELKRTVAGTRQANALAYLSELDSSRAVNVADLERRLGEVSPTLRVMFEALRALSGWRPR